MEFKNKNMFHQITGFIESVETDTHPFNYIKNFRKSIKLKIKNSYGFDGKKYYKIESLTFSPSKQIGTFQIKDEKFLYKGVIENLIIDLYKGDSK